MFKKAHNNIPSNLKNEIKSIAEEYANMISHGIGLITYILVSPFLIWKAINTHNTLYVTGVIIFIISLLMVYLSSTWYHSSFDKNNRQKLRVFDHISIYFLIAGSYTPFLLCHFQDKLGFILLTILWSMVLIGSIFKIFFTHKYNLISTAAYLIMGWQAIIIINPIIERLPTVALTWIVIGGISYSIGVVFYLMESMRYNHFIWHIFVLFGSTSHLLAVSYCLG